MVIKTKESMNNLCDYCLLKIPTCPKAIHIKFGNGIGNDNVIECSEYVVRSFHNNYPITSIPELRHIKKIDMNKPDN